MGWSSALLRENSHEMLENRSNEVSLKITLLQFSSPRGQWVNQLPLLGLRGCMAPRGFHEANKQNGIAVNINCWSQTNFMKWFKMWMLLFWFLKQFHLLRVKKLVFINHSLSTKKLMEMEKRTQLSLLVNLFSVHEIHVHKSWFAQTLSWKVLEFVWLIVSILPWKWYIFLEQCLKTTKMALKSTNKTCEIVIVLNTIDVQQLKCAKWICSHNRCHYF